MRTAANTQTQLLQQPDTLINDSITIHGQMKTNNCNNMYRNCREVDKVGRFSTILWKEDNFSDFLFDFVLCKSLLKRSLLHKKRTDLHGELFKERICSQRWHFLSFCTLRKQAYSNILKILLPKDEKKNQMKILIFSYFCSKHRLWVFIRIASASTHNLCFCAEIREMMYISVNPSFTI